MTSNNELFGSESLISKTSPLYETISKFSKDQAVTFSGVFYAADKDVIKEMSLGEYGSMTRPEFLFKFSYVSAK